MPNTVRRTAASPKREKTHAKTPTNNHPDKPSSTPPEGTHKSAADKARKLPVALFVPNLIGYVRFVTLIVGARCDNPASGLAICCLTISLMLDYIDGPIARKLDQCSQFGDLLDHYCDHLSMMYLVYVTYQRDSYFGILNVLVNAIHNGIVCVYMLYHGHYMKHGASNRVTDAIEENNYWNIWSLMWSFNTCVIPLIKLSYMYEHACLSSGPSTVVSTLLLDVADASGMLVSVVYTIAMWM